jgi:hypothetical protein
MACRARVLENRVSERNVPAGILVGFTAAIVDEPDDTRTLSQTGP